MSVPESFDWVAARFECSLPNLFKRLELMIKSDVDTVNALEGNAARMTGGLRTRGFSVINNGNRFSVNRIDRDAPTLHSVDFELTPLAISVTGETKAPFVATMRLNLQGRCVLVVDDTELELWQVRQMALENLFFGA